MIQKSVNSKQFMRIAKKFGIPTTQEHIKTLENGTILGMLKDLDTGKEITYVLNEIYIKKFNMRYSCHQKIKSGGEMIISNFELPRGKVIN